MGVTDRYPMTEKSLPYFNVRSTTSVLPIKDPLYVFNLVALVVPRTFYYRRGCLSCLVLTRKKERKEMFHIERETIVSLSVVLPIQYK